MNYVINKAILKNVDSVKLERYEIRQFKELYGGQFDDMLDPEIFKLWE